MAAEYVSLYHRLIEAVSEPELLEYEPTPPAILQ
jgi:hypothetical protein